MNLQFFFHSVVVLFVLSEQFRVTRAKFQQPVDENEVLPGCKDEISGQPASNVRTKRSIGNIFTIVRGFMGNIFAKSGLKESKKMKNGFQHLVTSSKTQQFNFGNHQNLQGIQQAPQTNLKSLASQIGPGSGSKSPKHLKDFNYRNPQGLEFSHQGGRRPSKVPLTSNQIRLRVPPSFQSNNFNHDVSSLTPNHQRGMAPPELSNKVIKMLPAPNLATEAPPVTDDAFGFSSMNFSTIQIQNVDPNQENYDQKAPNSVHVNPFLSSYQTFHATQEKGNLKVPTNLNNKVVSPMSPKLNNERQPEDFMFDNLRENVGKKVTKPVKTSIKTFSDDENATEALFPGYEDIDYDQANYQYDDSDVKDVSVLPTYSKNQTEQKPIGYNPKGKLNNVSLNDQRHTEAEKYLYTEPEKIVAHRKREHKKFGKKELNNKLMKINIKDKNENGSKSQENYSQVPHSSDEFNAESDLDFQGGSEESEIPKLHSEKTKSEYLSVPLLIEESFRNGNGREQISGEPTIILAGSPDDVQYEEDLEDVTASQDIEVRLSIDSSRGSLQITKANRPTNWSQRTRKREQVQLEG